MQPCPDCHGSKLVRCTVCEGTGFHIFPKKEECGFCLGKGRRICPRCAGVGNLPDVLFG